MGAGFILSVALGSGIVCGLWAGFGTFFAASAVIATWAGFAGCTSYFAAGCGPKGLIRSMCSNYVGILIGMIVIILGNVVSSGVIFSGLCTGFFTFVICFLSHCDLTKVIPCTFIGGFSAFATGGDWKMLCVSLLLGNLVGLGSDYLGRLFYQKFGSNKDGKKDWVIFKLPEDQN